MRRYTFLLLAFFLTNSTLANVNSTPDLRSNRNTSVPDIRKNPKSVPGTNTRATDIRRTSPRNTGEVGGVIEPAVSGTTDNTLFNSSGNGSRNAPATKTTKTSANSMSCKTYEGKIYDQGEAGYSDCMRNIRTDRQGTRSVP